MTEGLTIPKEKKFRVVFKNGHDYIVRAHGFKKAGDSITFQGADNKTDADIWLDAREVLLISPTG
jgi:hypothetical protein